MNLIPIVLTILAIVFGSIFAEFETGLLLGLIVGLIALQRDTHLKLFENIQANPFKPGSW